MRYLVGLLATLIGVLAWGAAASERGTTCPLPEGISAALQKRFPTYRRITADDLSEEDYSAYFGSKSPECWGMLRADFDGDGTQDYAIHLYCDREGTELVVVAFLRKGQWILSPVADPGKCRAGSCAIELMPAGEYEDESTGGIRRFRTPGFYWATLEACGAYYFWTPIGWIKF